MAEREHKVYTAEGCFQKAAERLLVLDDEVAAIRRGYEDRSTAAEWRRLGQAIRGDAVKEYVE